jgi:proline dehydrogenase
VRLVREAGERRDLGGATAGEEQPPGSLEAQVELEGMRRKAMLATELPDQVGTVEARVACQLREGEVLPCSAVNAPLDRRLLFKLVTSDGFERAVRGIPGGTALSWRWARRYVAGTAIENALARAHDLAASGISASIDMFGERVTDPSEADRVTSGYVELAERVRSTAPPGTWLSLDLSHLAIATDPEAAAGRLRSIVDALPPGARVQIGAEEAALADPILGAILTVPDPSSVTATLQANLRRSAADAERLARAGVPIRLVKGAYVESPVDALPYGELTDLNYLALAERLGELGAEVMLATHDAVLREACRHLLPRAGVEMLLGVRPQEATRLAQSGVPVRVYVAYGPNWFRYSMRRAAEARGAGGGG